MVLAWALGWAMAWAQGLVPVWAWVSAKGLAGEFACACACASAHVGDDV